MQFLISFRTNQNLSHVQRPYKNQSTNYNKISNPLPVNSKQDVSYDKLLIGRRFAHQDVSVNSYIDYENTENTLEVYKPLNNKIGEDYNYQNSKEIPKKKVYRSNTNASNTGNMDKNYQTIHHSGQKPMNSCNYNISYNEHYLLGGYINNTHIQYNRNLNNTDHHDNTQTINQTNGDILQERDIKSFFEKENIEKIMQNSFISQQSKVYLAKLQKKLTALDEERKRINDIGEELNKNKESKHLKFRNEKEGTRNIQGKGVVSE